MNLLKILILFAFLTSCALTPDFEFYYERNGQEFHAIGTSAAKFKQGDTLKIKIPKYPCRKCTAIVMTGNHDIRKSCKGKKGSFLEIDLGEITPRTLKTVSLSVVRKGWDTQTGKLYLGLNNVDYEAVPLDYKCPYQSEKDNQFTCMRPKSFKFIFSVYPQEIGAIQISSSDCVGQKIKQLFTTSYDSPQSPSINDYWQDLTIDVWKKYNGENWIESSDLEGGDRVDFTIDPNGAEGYCPLRIDFKSDSLKQSSTLHVDFYKV